MPAQKISDSEIISRLEAGETVEQIWRETHANKDRIRRLRNSRNPLETISQNVVPQIHPRKMVPHDVAPNVAPGIRTPEPSTQIATVSYARIQWYCRNVAKTGGKVNIIGIDALLSYLGGQFHGV